MRTKNLLLVSLLVAMYGCQPETPAQPSVAPESAPVPASAPVELSTPVAMMPASAPAPVAEPAPVAKPAPAVQEKAAAVKAEAPAAKPPVPASASATPAVKAEPAQIVAAAAVKPEVKPEPMPVAAMSDADALQLAKKSGCLVCHAIDKKVVGPAWKDVAAKYRGDAGAEARMMDKIAKGGSGVWGAIMMPANPKIGEADRRALARFVLSLK